MRNCIWNERDYLPLAIWWSGRTHRPALTTELPILFQWVGAMTCRMAINTTLRRDRADGETDNLFYGNRKMSEKITFQDIDGKKVSGHFKVSDGKITVTAPDGRTRTVDIDESMLGTGTLAKMLLLQMHRRDALTKVCRRHT
jgi:hypothetical protein